MCRERIARDPGLAGHIADRGAHVGARHDALFAKWAEQSRRNWDASPIALPRGA